MDTTINSTKLPRSNSSDLESTGTKSNFYKQCWDKFYVGSMITLIAVTTLAECFMIVEGGNVVTSDQFARDKYLVAPLTGALIGFVFFGLNEFVTSLFNPVMEKRHRQDTIPPRQAPLIAINAGPEVTQKSVKKVEEGVGEDKKRELPAKSKNPGLPYLEELQENVALRQQVRAEVAAELQDIETKVHASLQEEEASARVARSAALRSKLEAENHALLNKYQGGFDTILDMSFLNN